MSTKHPTLPTGPLPHLAMDYARLRAAGIELLGRLAGAQWTDYNTHDPGITILEQLCYAISDFGYRCNFPLADLLAASPDPGLPGPAEILPSDPVTSADLRRLALDIAATDNAWVGPAAASLPVYFHEGSGELRLVPDPSEPAATPVELRGLLQVAVQTHDEFSGDAALDQVAQRLHAARLLGSDFEVDWLASVEITIDASIEVGALDEPTAVLADIIERIEECLAPAASFISLSEARARGMGLDQCFEGPALERGIVDALPSPRASVFASDLIHAITDVAQVRAVRSISPKQIEIPAGKIARLGKSSSLILQRAGLPLRADLGEARRLVEQRRHARRLEPIDLRSLAPAAGRDRQLARYRSIQRQLPAAYGIGTLGLPSTASIRRHAQARQLEAYLLIFDQLLANQFAQLAHAHELLSPGPEDGASRTYFAQPVDDPPLNLQRLLGARPETATPEQARQWLDEQVEDDGLERRKRFLAHLLARYAEQLDDYSEVRHAGRDRASLDLAVIEERQAFLRDYPRLSAGRGSGEDLRAGTSSGLAERLRLKIGMPELRFELVEHLLLRPVPEDRNQLDADGEAPVPLLAGLDAPDPWSLQLGVVFEQPSLEGRDEAWFEALQRFVAQTVLAEAPAHLSIRLHWLDAEGDTTYAAFSAALADFRTKLREYRWPQPDDPIRDPRLVQLRFRDARDRLSDLLGLGFSFPLRDLPWTQHLIVPPGTATTITLEFSQRGVDYELRDRNDAPVLREGQPIRAEGSGGVLTLPTPPIEVDVTYRVLAIKREPTDQASPEARAAWLHGAVVIQEGVDPTLTIEIIDLPLLDPRIDKPKPTDARIVDYGEPVQVAIYDSQEGVDYELRDHANPDTVLSAKVVGTSGTIVLTLASASEDIDLRVHGSKNIGDAQNPELRAAMLDLVLPLRVRANPKIAAELVAAIVAQGGDAAVKLSTTQKSVRYQAWQRAIRDREFVFDAKTKTATIDVPGEDGRTIRVARPPRSAVWEDLPGFTTRGAAKAGNGKQIQLALGGSERDVFVLIQASKQHRKESAALADAELIPSAVQLDKALALFVRPDHERTLHLQVEVDAKTSVGAWLVEDGQPGVYYELRLGEQAIALPAYFHQRDDVDAKLNKGLGQLRLEVDAAVARDNVAGLPPATTAPPSPLLESTQVPLGSELSVLARKAMSGVSAALMRTIVLPATPSVKVEKAKIVIADSVVGERYSLWRADVLVGQREGDGATLELELEVPSETTRFVLVLERSDEKHQRVERRLALTVEGG